MEIMDARGVGSKHVGGIGKWYPCLYCNRLSHFEGMMLVALLRYQMFHSSKATQLISHHVKCTYTKHNRSSISQNYSNKNSRRGKVAKIYNK